MIQTVAASSDDSAATGVLSPPVYIGGYEPAAGTTNSGWSPAVDWNFVVVEQTNSGLVIQGNSRRSSGSAIMELRRLTGFSWDQLARLFGVNRRSLHFWASGEPPSPANEERLQRVLAAVRRIDRGTASVNRSLLLSPLSDGIIPYDLLIASKYDEVVDRLGSGPVGVRPRPGPLSPQAAALRRPPKPHELMGALQDPVHIRKGRLLSAIPVNTKREK